MQEVLKTIEVYGEPLTSQKIVPGNTRTAVSSGGYQYTERTLAFTSGGTTEIVVGDVICQSAGAIQAVVTAISAITGTWAGGNAAGTLTVKNQIGTFAAGAIYVGAGTDEATIAANSTAVSTTYPFKNKLAKVAVLQAIAQSALVCIDGSKPDQTLIKGITVAANGTLVIVGSKAIQQIIVVDRVASSASTVFIQYYF